MKENDPNEIQPWEKDGRIYELRAWQIKELAKEPCQCQYIDSLCMPCQAQILIDKCKE